MATESAAKVTEPKQKGVAQEESGHVHCPHCAHHDERLGRIEEHLGLNGPSGPNEGSEADIKLSKHSARKSRDEGMAKRKRH